MTIDTVVMYSARNTRIHPPKMTRNTTITRATYRYNTKYFNDPAAGGGTFTPNPPHTPQLDAWATGPGSIIFERFYSGNPVCSPTRAALLSGRTPFRDCIQDANEQQPFPAITHVGTPRGPLHGGSLHEGFANSTRAAPRESLYGGGVAYLFLY